jgi:putative membrane protein
VARQRIQCRCSWRDAAHGLIGAGLAGAKDPAADGSAAHMKAAAYIGGALGLILLSGILLHADLPALWHTAALAGGKLLWLVPYRLLFFMLYALGWAELLRPYVPGKRIGLMYVFWVTTVREAVDRLLPVASVGGGVVGVRLMHMRGLPIAAVSATVIVEILLTLASLYLFAVIGLLLLIDLHPAGTGYRYLVPVLLLTFPVPVVTAALLRYGSVFARLQGILRRIAGIDLLAEGAASLDEEIRSCLRRKSSLLFAGTLQLAALISGSLEIWFVLRIVGHPIGVGAAIVMEGLMQALRHAAFVVPAGIGVQEAALIGFGHALGVGADMALTVSLAKRVREILCGVPPLISWWMVEGRLL